MNEFPKLAFSLLWLPLDLVLKAVENSLWFFQWRYSQPIDKAILNVSRASSGRRPQTIQGVLLAQSPVVLEYKPRQRAKHGYASAQDRDAILAMSSSDKIDGSKTVLLSLPPNCPDGVHLYERFRAAGFPILFGGKYYLHCEAIVRGVLEPTRNTGDSIVLSNIEWITIRHREGDSLSDSVLSSIFRVTFRYSDSLPWVPSGCPREGVRTRKSNQNWLK